MKNTTVSHTLLNNKFIQNLEEKKKCYQNVYMLCLYDHLTNLSLYRYLDI